MGSSVTATRIRRSFILLGVGHQLVKDVVLTSDQGHLLFNDVALASDQAEMESHNVVI